jgi:hypothetical protein
MKTYEHVAGGEMIVGGVLIQDLLSRVGSDVM